MQDSSDIEQARRGVRRIIDLTDPYLRRFRGAVAAAVFRTLFPYCQLSISLPVTRHYGFYCRVNCRRSDKVYR
jgi:hypothetical protein